MRIALCSPWIKFQTVATLLCFSFSSFGQSPEPSEVSLAPSVVAPSVVAISGLLLEKGTRTPIAGANVYVLPAKVRGVSDESGHFSIANVPVGAISFVVNLAGYEKLEQNDVVESESDSQERRLYLTKQSYQVYETTVYGKGDKRDDRTRSLKVSEILKMAGSNGDPVKAIQNMPGVSRPVGFSSQVIIEGSAPQDTKYTIDGHQVPIIFHFGGLSSVIFPESIDRVDYLASGYGPEYSRALGGLVGVWTRDGKTDRSHGIAQIDLFQAGALYEGPVGDSGSILVAARQSYIGQVLQAALKNNKDFDLTVAPSYTDLVAIYQTRLGGGDRFRVTSVGSLDQLRFLFDSPIGRDSSGRGAFSNTTAFFRVIPQLYFKLEEETYARLSLGLGRDFIHLDIFDQFFDLKTYTLSARGEFETKLATYWKTHLGFDNQYTWTKYGYRLPSAFSAGGPGGSGSSSTSAPIQNQDTPQFSEIGVYWRNELHATDSKWTLLPSLRADYFNGTKELIPEPRFAVRYQLDESLTLRSAYGNYAQSPQGQEVDPLIGNPNLKAPRAWHLTLGAEKDFRERSANGFVVSGDVFYKELDRIVESSSQTILKGGLLQPERYNNGERGRAYGVALLARYDRKPWSAWLAYTLSRSTRVQPGKGEFTFQYDQTHILSALGSVELGNNWLLSSRVRLVTGNAYTPVADAVFDDDDDIYRSIKGSYFSARLPAFFSLDARIEKKWIYDTWNLTGYLEIQNLTNRKNAEGIRYSYNYQKSENVSFLPLIPIIGVKGEF